LKKQLATTAVLLFVLLATVTGCGPQPSRGWDTDPDKLMEQIAEGMRDLLIESNFEPLADDQPLSNKREMALTDRWPGTGMLFGWYRGTPSFAGFESCISDELADIEPCRQREQSHAWWVAEGKLGEADPSEWEWIRNVNLEKHDLSYIALVILLDETGDKALVYVDHRCPGKCGNGLLYTLERREDGWYVLNSKSIWQPE
jgi:hypothetical protein